MKNYENNKRGRGRRMAAVLAVFCLAGSSVECLPVRTMVKAEESDGEAAMYQYPDHYIEDCNRASFSRQGSHLTDLSVHRDYMAAEILSMIESYKEPAASLLNYQGRVQGDFQAAYDNRNLASLTDPLQLEYGILTENTQLRSFPTQDRLSEPANAGTGQCDFDLLLETGLSAGEGVVIAAESLDQVWRFVIAEDYCGWIRSSSIGLCSEEEMVRWIRPEEFAVITDANVTFSTQDGDGLTLRMGSRLPVVRGGEESSRFETPVSGLPVSVEERQVSEGLSGEETEEPSRAPGLPAAEEESQVSEGLSEENISKESGEKTDSSGRTPENLHETDGTGNERNNSSESEAPNASDEDNQKAQEETTDIAPSSGKPADGEGAAGETMGERESGSVKEKPEAAGEEPETTGEESGTAGEEPETAGEEPETAGEESGTAGEEPETAGEESETVGEEPETAGEESETAGEEPETAGEESETAEEESASVGDGQELAPRQDDGSREEVPDGNREEAGKDILPQHYLLLPRRAGDGSLAAQALQLPDEGVRLGYLPLSENAMMAQAEKLLGFPYGWGDENGGMDCTSTVRAVYSCFGLLLPRNSGWMPSCGLTVQRLDGMDLPQRYAYLRQIPKGSVLLMKGHAMLYAGFEDGRPVIIHNVTRFRAVPGGELLWYLQCVRTPLEIYSIDDLSYAGLIHTVINY